VVLCNSHTRASCTSRNGFTGFMSNRKWHPEAP
jgi:hypothetical protein